MNPGRRSRWGRTFPAFALAVACLVTSGCVYLRLLELKRQFEQFDRFFSLDTATGVRITCHQPVLRTDDVRWIGLKPEIIRRVGHAQQWQVRWVKQIPPGVTETEAFDIAIDLTFADEKLTRVAIPERYFALMPKSFLIDVIKSLGGASIDKSGKTIEAAVGGDLQAIPNLPGIDRILGRPTEERIEGTRTVTRYVYMPATKESRAGVFDMTLYFDTASGELLSWQGRTPIGRIGFNFAPSPKR